MRGEIRPDLLQVQQSAHHQPLPELRGEDPVLHLEPGPPGGEVQDGGAGPGEGCQGEEEESDRQHRVLLQLTVREGQPQGNGLVKALAQFELLFQLVHIVCHDKQEHTSRVCDTKQFYIK